MKIEYSARGCGKTTRAIQEAADEITRLRAEKERLREALVKISSPTQSTRLLWWQIEARAALNTEGEG